MAENMNRPDVNDMFQKMGEKLGWFKHKNLSEATHQLKKTKMKNENGHQGSGNTNGKRAGKLKLKKKIKANLAAEQPEKPVMPDKHNLPHSKAQSFQVILSSDSDSDFTSEPQHCKEGRRKAVLQVCSDSDDDPIFPARVKKDSDACVQESFLDSETGTDIPEFEPILDIKPKRNSAPDWNDTVVKNRVSLASCTLDLDNLGEPLVESTRIHRRSSVTFSQIIDSPDSSKEDGNGLCAVVEKENVNACEQEYIKNGDKNFTFITSVCEETKYITALETVDDTLDSSGFNMNVEESKKFSCREGEPDKMMKNGNKGKLCLDKRSDQCNTDSDRREQRRSNSSDLCEEIEVMDTATQTEEYEAFEKDDEILNIKSDKNVHRAYKERTVVDNSGEMTDSDKQHRGINNVYNEDTVEYSHGSVQIPFQCETADDLDQADSESDEQSSIHACSAAAIKDLEDRLASTTIQTNINEYSKETVGHENESFEKDDVYSEITASGNNNYYFEQDKDSRCSDDTHFENDEFILDKDRCTKLPAPPKSKGEKHKEIRIDETDSESIADETKSDSEGSMCEVCDAGTQTVEMEKVVEYDIRDKIRDCDVTDDVKEPDVTEDVEEHDVTDDVQTSDIERKICRDRLSDSRQNESSNSEMQQDFVDKEMDYDNVTEGSSTESSKDECLVSTDNSSDSSKSISASFAKVTTKSDVSKKKKERQKKADITEQSWRSERKYSSDSGSDGDLEAFFQKLRQPEKKKSETSSPESMKDFIIDDDDVTSESEDSGFYLRETLEMENRKESQIVEVLGSDDESDDFSSEIYPTSVTKHKKRIQGNMRKRTNVSWSFSSDSEDEAKAKNSKPARKPTGTSKKTNHVNDTQPKSAKTSGRNPSSNVDLELSTDSDDEVFNVKTSRSEAFNDDKERSVGNRKTEPDKTASVSDNGLNGARKGKMGSAEVDDEQCLFKTPNVLRKKKIRSDDNKENEFKTPVSTKGKVAKTPKSSTKPVYISLSDIDSDEDSSGFTVSLTDSSVDSKISGTLKALGNSNLSATLSLKKATTPTSAKITPTCTFLKSLSNTLDESRRHAEARRFVYSFNKCREELSTYLFKLYNKTIFENKLPSDMPVIWNKRLLRTAGYCAYKKNAKNDKDRSTRIELSVKVCDNAERARDTLIHEMCHAAVWILNGVNGGHGPYWKYWARHATRIHPELPAVSVCHSYSINTKFTYRCKSCGYSIGRHSKSLDVKKKVCGYCRGEFELIRNSVPTTPTSATSTSASSTPRPPSKFALFVKDNYNSVKRQNQTLKHGDVMKELSKLFAESKITS